MSIIISDQIENLYDIFIDKYWRKQSNDIVWTYTKCQRNIGMLNEKEMILQCNDWLNKFDVRCFNYNNKSFVVKGKEWHTMTVQFYKDGELSDDANEYDPCAMFLANTWVSGFVYWFEDITMRNNFHQMLQRECGICKKRNPKNFMDASPLAPYCCIKCMNDKVLPYREEQANKRKALAELKRIKEENERREAEANALRIADELLAEEKKEKKQRKVSPPKKEECPLSPAELKSIPPRPPAKIRTPAGSLIDNKAKQQQWDNKYAIYRKWL